MSVEVECDRANGFVVVKLDIMFGHIYLKLCLSYSQSGNKSLTCHLEHLVYPMITMSGVKHGVAASFMQWWCFAAVASDRWHREERKLHGNTKANASSKWTVTPSMLPKLRQNVFRTTKGTTPDPNPAEHLWAELKKR